MIPNKDEKSLYAVQRSKERCKDANLEENPEFKILQFDFPK